MMISAIEHYSYCPRQCGLIHIEDVFDENVFTIRGRQVHDRVDEPIARFERGKRVERALPIWSETFGLTGRADVVEIEEGTQGVIIPMPVEYKSGKARHADHASLQLCAQAICLEEMFKVPVTQGALYFFAEKKRLLVAIDSELRRQTLAVVDAIRAMMAGGGLPAPVADIGLLPHVQARMMARLFRGELKRYRPYLV